MQADGTRQTRLTRHPADDYGPIWSPDGRQIAFVSNRSGKDQIWVMVSRAPRDIASVSFQSTA